MQSRPTVLSEARLSAARSSTVSSDADWTTARHFDAKKNAGSTQGGLRRRSRAGLRTKTSLLLGLLVLVNACQCDDDIRVIPGTIEGIVCHPDNGRPVAAVDILVTDANGQEVGTTATDSFGVWTLDRVTPGPVVVTCLVDDLAREWEVEVLSDEVVTVEDAECRPPPPPPPPPTGSVEGCVCETDVGWVAGANVFVQTASGDTIATGTGEDGCFVLENIPAGSQEVRVLADGGFSTAYPVDVVADTVTTLESPESCEPPEPQPEPEPSPVPEVGNVQGRVCAPDGETWLSGAEVFVNLDGGGRVDTLTDGDGHYLLEGAPAGLQTVQIRKGSFESAFEVEIPANDTVVIPEEECQIEQNVAIAVVDGQWDDVRSVLVNVGIDGTQIVDVPNTGAGALLGDYEALTQYDILFFNCGLVETSYLSDAVYAQNLRAFVEQGGSVYASDQAYDVVEKAFPEYIEFHGDDATVDAAQRGAIMDAVLANVTDLALATALGANTLELHYPLPAWSVMESVSSDVRTYVRGDAEVMLGITGILTQTLNNVPHTVGFDVGQGSVIYTSFHQEPGINVMMERVLQILVFEL